MNEPKYQFERSTLGELECGIVRPVDREAQIECLAVLCHGFGAGGDDLVGLAGEVLQVLPPDHNVMMVFPAAPLSLEDQGMPGGRAWWLLSIQRLISALEDGRFELVREEEPAGIDDARQKLCVCIETALQMSDLDASRLLLGGFSQGAMLSMDVACRGLPTPPAAMCLYSGCLICERQWRSTASKLESTDIFQSHGRLDPVLPLQTGKWLTELLAACGCNVDYFEFNGVHTIPMEAIEKTAHQMTKLCQSAGQGSN